MVSQLCVAVACLLLLVSEGTKTTPPNYSQKPEKLPISDGNKICYQSSASASYLPELLLLRQEEHLVEITMNQKETTKPLMAIADLLKEQKVCTEKQIALKEKESENEAKTLLLLEKHIELKQKELEYHQKELAHYEKSYEQCAEITSVLKRLEKELFNLLNNSVLTMDESKKDTNVATTEPLPRCPSSVIRPPGSEKRYCLGESERLSFDEAAAYCWRLGGALAAFEDMNELNLFWNCIKSEDRVPNEDIWVGATDREVEGRWFWNSGHQITSNSPIWSDGEPTQTLLQNCGYLSVVTFSLCDYECSFRHIPLCEI